MNFFSYLVIAGMSWFIFLSAYLFFRNLNKSNIGQKYVSRIRTLVIPYILWNSGGVLLKIIKNENIFSNGIWGFIRENYVFYNNTGCANGPLWYIFRIFTYLAVAPLIYCICKNKKNKFIVIIIGFILMINIKFRANYFSFLYFLPIYIIGAYIGINYKEAFENLLSGYPVSEKKYNIVEELIVLITICCVGGAANAYSSMYIITLICRHISLFFVARLASCLTFDSLDGFIAGGSMYIFCCHDLIYRCLRKILFKTGLNIMIQWILLSVITFIVIYSSWQILAKNCPKLLNFLCGGRAFRGEIK